MKSLLAKCALTFGGLLIALLGLELVVRMAHLNSSRRYASDRPRMYFLPQQSESLQGNITSTHTARDAFKVAVVGDSFTFAPKMQFDDSFVKRLETWLNLGSDELQFSVSNQGIPGYSTVQEATVVRKILETPPDLILLQITLNDPQLRPLSGEPREIQEKFGRLPPRILDNFIVRQSEALKFIIQRLHNQRSISAYIDYHHQLFDQPETWARFSGALRQITEHASRAKVPVAAVLFPLFDFPIDARYPFLETHKKIRELSKELGLPLLDLRRSFEGMNPLRLQLVPGRDSHPNEIAHRIAAERLLPWLIKRQLVPLSPKAFRVFRQRDNLHEKQFDLSTIAR